jgi:prepilin peptidase CpaA
LVPLQDAWSESAEGPLLESLGGLERTPLSGNDLGWGIAFVAVAIASVIDWRSRKIPNLLTFPLAGIALLGNAVAGGFHGMLSALLGLAVGLVFFLLLMALGAMGPGDVKLMAGLGALLGILNVFWIGLFTAVMGGVLAVLYSLGKGSLPRMVHRTWMLVRHIVFTGHLPKAEELGATREDYMPYALAIALGVTAQYLWRGAS